MGETFSNPICRGGAFGSMPFGAGFFGSQIAGGITDVEVVDANTIDVTHQAEVPADLTNPALWLVLPLGLGAPQTVVSAIELIPTFKTRLIVAPGLTPGEAYGLGFIKSEPEWRIDCREIAIVGPPPPPVDLPTPPVGLLPKDQPFDIANPQLVRDAGVIDPPPLGQYQINDRGDFALDSHLQSLRGRILRRAQTLRGGFFHLPDYGFARGIKEPIRPTDLVALAADAKIQVEREPEVIRATVNMQQLRNAPGVVVQTIRARTIGGLDITANQTLDLRPSGLRS